MKTAGAEKRKAVSGRWRKMDMVWCGCLQSRTLYGGVRIVQKCLNVPLLCHILTPHLMTLLPQLSCHLFYSQLSLYAFNPASRENFFFLPLTMFTMDNPLFPPLLVLIHSVSTLGGKKWDSEIQYVFCCQNLRITFTNLSSKQPHFGTNA